MAMIAGGTTTCNELPKEDKEALQAWAQGAPGVPVNIMEETGKESIKGNPQSQALRVKGILQSESKWSNGSNKSNNGYHVTWGGNTIVGRKHTTLLSSLRDRLCALANAPIT